MEGEINNFILVWLTAVVSLCYCYQVGKIFPTVSKARLLAILPVSCLFLYLPLNLTSIHLGGTTSFFISWLCNFKIILFAFNKGPLSSNPPIPLSRFIPDVAEFRQRRAATSPRSSGVGYRVGRRVVVNWGMENASSWCLQPQHTGHRAPG
ncbi:acyl-CoA--sterol O-acyltransferase 1-like [Dorcoceras hygrometricum]|uniref:Acyl-CoA--sterol O-acyltransferase 1-like n=1 Tax=Dorcoceras hygrometricum TaxID=472368 RepID=A0A2Z7C564_9LAMI|nr:acyl-CoA--sterol O-acyltransferase 1-like [Dorcoceras hygrometricum]